MTQVNEYSPETREFAFAVETTPGTAGTTIIHEVCEDVTIRFMRQTFRSAGFRKAAATTGKSYVTQRWVEVDVRMTYHSAGFGAFALGCMAGKGSEGAVTGITPKIHTFTTSAGNNSLTTLTTWFDLGDHNHVLQMVRGVMSSWAATINPQGALELSMTFTANWPTYTSSVTPTNYVGSTANYPITPILGSDGTYTIQSGAGTAYTNNILDVSLQLQRTVTPIPNAQSKDPASIRAGEIAFSGTIHAEYDGASANTAQDDFMQYANLGGSALLNTFALTNSDGHGFEIDAYYLRWDDFQPDFSSQCTMFSTPFHAENDESQLDQATPAITAPKTIIIKNALTTAMTN